jgi:hypothetical protein
VLRNCAQSILVCELSTAILRLYDQSNGQTYDANYPITPTTHCRIDLSPGPDTFFMSLMSSLNTMTDRPGSQ